MLRFSWLILIPSLTMAAKLPDYSVSFAAQTLQQALSQFSRTVDQNILYDPSLVGYHEVPAISGRYTAQQLLNKILQDTELCASKVDTAWLVMNCPTQPSNTTPKVTRHKPNHNNPIEEITVTGFRQSLIKAREFKRLSMVTQDSILAEDIADFPDLNLADSLQRVPGISITREGGEGRQISLRGLGPDFTRVTINGVTAMGMSSSPMDARGSVTRSRAFDFNIFASELFNRVDVKKSYSVAMEEGGIGGTVELTTPKPFDFNDTTFVYSYRHGFNSNSQSYDPRAAAMFAKQWSNWGSLLSLAYSERYTREFGTNTTRWRKEQKDYVGDHEALAQPLADGDLWFPRGHRYSVWNNQQSRLGVTATIQYQPNNNFSSNWDFFYSRLQNQLDEHHIAVKDNHRVRDVMWIDNDGDAEVIYAEYKDAAWRAETREDFNQSEFQQLSWTTNWQISPTTSFDFLVGLNWSKYQQPKLNKVNIRADGVDIITDFRNDRFYGISYSPGFDVTDATQYQVKDLYFEENYMSSDMKTAKLSVHHQITSTDSLVLGISYKNLDNSGHDRIQSDFPNNPKTPNHQGDFELPYDATELYQDHPDFNWVQANLPEIQQYYGLLGHTLDEGAIIDASNYSVDEETSAIYGVWETITSLSGMPLAINSGVRFFETTLTSAGLSKGVYTEIERAYSDWLPSVNMVLDVTDDLLWRFSASKNITRPSIDKLSFSAEVSQASRNEGDMGTIAVGNPYLEPFRSINVDTGLEYYFNEQGLLSLALFYKDIDNFIVEQSSLQAYKSLGLPQGLLQDGDSVNDLFIVTTPENTDSSTFKGIELALSRDLSFLPEPLNHLGITANYTWADGTALYRDVQGSGHNETKTFSGLSNHNYNLTLYYESDLWSARISSAYRSDYILSVQAGNTDQDESGYHDTTYIDATASYQLTDTIKLTLEGLNLTNERQELYSDSNDRAYNTTTSGRTWLLGISGQF